MAQDLTPSGATDPSIGTIVWSDFKVAGIPAVLVDKLGAAYGELKENYFLGRHRPGELEGGHFAEAALRVLQWATGGLPDGTPFTPLGAQLPRFDQEVARLSTTSTKHPKSLRIHIPRVLLTMQDVRNGRGVGHISGDVDPNEADASLLVACADWVLAELIRIFHGRSLSEAQRIVDSIAERRVPFVQIFGDRRKVLRPDLARHHRILAILYNRGAEGAAIRDLALDLRLPTNETRRLVRFLDSATHAHFEDSLDRTYITRAGLLVVEDLLLQPIRSRNDSRRRRGIASRQ